MSGSFFFELNPEKLFEPSKHILVPTTIHTPVPDLWVPNKNHIMHLKSVWVILLWAQPRKAFWAKQAYVGPNYISHADQIFGFPASLHRIIKCTLNMSGSFFFEHNLGKLFEPSKHMLVQTTFQTPDPEPPVPRIIISRLSRSSWPSSWPWIWCGISDVCLS